MYSFVTSNPLVGYEHMPFEKAVQRAKELLNANVFPETAVFRQAWNKGEINEKVLLDLLKENKLLATPEAYLRQMECNKPVEKLNVNHELDRILAKWLAAFTDEGMAEWEMPNKREGFYGAWRNLAQYDTDLPKTAIEEIPKTSEDVLSNLLQDFSEKDFTAVLTYHLASLPGWTGYINHRNSYGSVWQDAYPITLQDYLGVRIWIAKKIKAPIYPLSKEIAIASPDPQLQYIWLKAWEKSWQNGLVKRLEKQLIPIPTLENGKQIIEAQMVFCIDTRSELIRRNIENKGNYETFGYAGFFGIAMDYKNLDDGVTRKSCPPILNSAYQVSEIAQDNKAEKFADYKKRIKVLKFKEYFLKRMKNMLPSAFGYVEGAGFFYGISLLTRTLMPGYFYRLKGKNEPIYESICEPELKKRNYEASDSIIPLAEKVAIVKGAFDLMGWQEFAPIVIFAGHGSHSANNAFSSSLDCGACAASPGRHNARMLARLANSPEVRETLKEKCNIQISTSTIFIGAEHNTTTDEIILFDSEVPNSHHEALIKLKINLAKAQVTATQERLGVATNSVVLAHKKASDWGETRPEWGLAKNAGLIVGSRNLTKNINLEGRCFLHSYNWETDTTGKALEAIMQGPMVVAQWINNHYYFSTVDNAVFGGGSKITHNITGKFGVVQGNGGDIKMGLPLQSVKQSDEEMYHQPLRLSVIIHAPLKRVSEILERNEHLKNILDNEWIYLMVMDTLAENSICQYQKNLNWAYVQKKSKI